MIFHPLGVLSSVNRSDIQTPEPATLPDQPATSRRTTAMDSRMSTLTIRGSILGAGPFLSIQSKRNWVPIASCSPAYPKNEASGWKAGRISPLLPCLLPSIYICMVLTISSYSVRYSLLAMQRRYGLKLRGVNSQTWPKSVVNVGRGPKGGPTGEGQAVRRNLIARLP